MIFNWTENHPVPQTYAFSLQIKSQPASKQRLSRQVVVSAMIAIHDLS